MNNDFAKYILDNPYNRVEVGPKVTFPLSQGFSTLHDIDAFRCSVAEISDYLAGNKRLIVLIVSYCEDKAWWL